MTTLADSIDNDLRTLITSVVSSHSCDDDGQFWATLNDLGLARLTAGEDTGGSGTTWREGAELVRALARHGCSLPYGESDLAAEWLLRQAGIDAEPMLRTAAVVDGLKPTTVPKIHPSVKRVAVLRQAAATGWAVADVDTNVIAAVRSQRRWPDDIVWHSIEDGLADAAVARIALVHSVQMTGAMETVTSLTIEHAQARTQFGRPLGKFQSVQQLTALLAAEAALARTATDSAVLIAAGDPLEQLLPAVAVARSCTGHAAEVVVRNAHQVIGALGTTAEHRLHQFTSSIMRWRSLDGGTRTWDSYALNCALSGIPLSDMTIQSASTI
jgi:alkylation response protein AidB-like acyl-CoA dehydrogenase